MKREQLKVMVSHGSRQGVMIDGEERGHGTEIFQ